MSLDFVPQMSNSELAEAIAAIQKQISETGTAWPQHSDFMKHHRMLLEAQAHRAVMFEIKVVS